MNKNWENNKYDERVRITKKNKEWLEKNKKAHGAKTRAAFVDKIINEFKKSKLF